MKRIDAMVYRPHSKAEACQWEARPDYDAGFGEGAEVSVVPRSDMDRLLAWQAWAQERMDMAEWARDEWDPNNPEPALP